MKKLLLSLTILCVASVAAMAQPYNSVTINNNTGCTVYVRLDGDVAGATCTTNYQSATIGIAPGITTYTDPSAVPGGMNDGFGNTLGSSDEFFAIEVASSNPIATNLCSVINVYYMSDCAGSMLTSTSSTFDDWNGVSCNSCGGGTVYNINLTSGGSVLQLDIN